MELEKKLKDLGFKFNYIGCLDSEIYIESRFFNIYYVKRILDTESIETYNDLVDCYRNYLML